MGIGLAGDQIHQLIVELWHIHQLGPGPGQAGAELRHEMLHPSLATGHAIGFKEAHLPPAQAKAHADGLVDFLGGGDAVFHQPQRLAPDGLKEAVGDMGVNFLADMQREHADFAQDGLGAFHRFGRVFRAGHHFGQGQKVDRVEGVGDKDHPGLGGLFLQFRGFEARGG